jgi:hypothetical protein
VIPAVRAAADRFIYDCANVKHIITSLPPEALDRAVPGSGWNGRQIAAHIAASQVEYAAILERWLAGRRAIDDDFDLDAINRQTAEAHRSTSVTALCVALDESLVRLIPQLERIDDDAMARPIGRYRTGGVMRVWAAHAREHGRELLALAPGLEDDPLVASWLRDDGAAEEQA